MTENQKLREALRELIEAYSRAGPELSRAERAVDRMRLIAAHEALALPTADHIPDAGEMVAEHLPDAGKMIETTAPVGEREAFEQFAQNCPMGKYNVTRRGEGYDSSHTQIMWDAWQARAALSAGDAVAVAKEREECAKVCEELWQRGVPGHANDCAAAIRARGEA